MPENQNLRRNLELDRLRAFAILMVLWAHLRWGFPGIQIPPWLSKGDAGVDLFFVISGFIISKSLVPSIDLALHRGTLREVRDSLVRVVSSFYIRRAFRLLPLCYLWIGLYVLGCCFFNAGGAFGKPENLPAEVLTILMFGYNSAFVEGGTLELAWHWSLSLEEQFYFTFPLLLIWVQPNSKRIRYALAWILLTAFVLRPSLSLMDPLPKAAVYRSLSFLRFDCILTGCLIYFLSQSEYLPRLSERFKPSRLWCWVVGWGILFLLVVITSVLTDRAYSAKYPVFTLLCSVLVYAASQERGLVFPMDAKYRLLDWIGKRSYALYLIHAPAFYFNRELWERISAQNLALPLPEPLLSMASCTAILALAAGLSHRWIEIPGTRLGRILAERWTGPGDRPSELRRAA